MDTQSYRTRLSSNRSIPVPAHIRRALKKGKEIEVTIREVRDGHHTVPDRSNIFFALQEEMNRQFSNIKTEFMPELVAVAGLTVEFAMDTREYSDRDLAGQARLEKYLEEGEIVEGLL